MSQSVRLTPKGWFVQALVEHHGLLEDQADEFWGLFETFVQQRLKEDYTDSSFAALVFDGGGGEVIGLEVHE
jgi:hypothetical protein